MKNACTLLFLFSFLLVAAVAHAQPDHDFLPLSLGTEQEVYHSPVSPFSPGSAGNGQTWDFSGMSFDFLGTFQSVDPATTPYAPEFLTSNAAVKIDIGLITQYVFLNANNLLVEELGQRGDIATIDYSVNKILEMYPLSFGDSIQNDYQEMSQPAMNYKKKYDGFGTLITPLGTFENVKRFYIEDGDSDPKYNWISSASNAVLYELDADGTDASYLTEPALITSDGLQFDHKEAKMTLFPNPVLVNKTLSMTFGEKVEHVVAFAVNTMGQSAILPIVQQKGKSVQLDGSQLSAGCYTVQVFADQGLIGSEKLLVVQ